ncbi:Lethal(3)malignant brain tumor-like protein 3 [Oopsacas minuta]|uniref:Lethal(3)malignant brain tumor-like protein 3 n=1 Tax=Oopsacas minuta TaxID=111878 RepID=A0AAV7JPD6_9METZ|nr:Lethal(3)malignant brain tumor-like protein 3 [Oopsacas minuta]
MNSVDNFGLDQMLSSSANFSFKSRDVSVSDSIQTSHSNSIGGSEESLTSPLGLPLGITVLPVKDSLSGLSLAVTQQNPHWNMPSYTSANYSNQNLNSLTNLTPVPSVIESSNKVIISKNDQLSYMTLPQQYIQIIQSPNDNSIPTTHTTEVMQMPNNNNSSNREIEELAVTTHIQGFSKPTSRLFPLSTNSIPTQDSLVNTQFFPISQNDVTLPVSQSQQVPLMQPPGSPRFILTSQSGHPSETYRIIQPVSKSGQQPTQMGSLPMQQVVLSPVSDVNQTNGHYQYSIIAPPFSNPIPPTQATKPISPPRALKGHKHLQNYPLNNRPQQAHVKVEPGTSPYVQLVENSALLHQTPHPEQEAERQRSESLSSGPGPGPGPRKRKTGVPRKIVQNPKIKKERNEAGEEMDYCQEGDDNSDELNGSPFGTESFPDMEYSPESDSCSFVPLPSAIEPQLFPRILLAEGSKVTFCNWNEYCQMTGSRPAPYALHNQNNSLLPESNMFPVGTNLEILDWKPDRHFAIRPVSVTKIQGSRLRLELLASAGGQSLWTTVDSYRLHYLGWGSERGLTYLPPDDILPNINWQEYIHDILAVQDNSNIDMFRSSFDQEMGAFFTLFRPGMLLEAAMDPLNRELISVCVVKRCSGQTVLLYEQNEDELSEFSRFYQEFSVDSPYIRPLGWANKHRKQLRPSKESSNSKDWPQLLAKIIIHKNRLPVPLEAFSRTSYFSPGMKLEAVDWREPDRIRVATVIAINEKQQIKLHYDGFPTEMENWFDVDGKDIFPPGYCDITGHKLEKPVELDISQAAPALLCPIPTARFLPSNSSSNSSPISLHPVANIDPPSHEEVNSPQALPPVVQELQPKVTVTLFVSHTSSHGPYLDPELCKLIPPTIGPTTPSQAQALLLTNLLNACVNRQLLWEMIEDNPVPNAVPLLYEPSSNICKFLPNIKSFHELFNFLNKLREKLDFGPDFIRIGAPPANHEVHQPEKIPSCIPPLTLPQSKNIFPTPVQPYQLPSSPSDMNIHMASTRNNVIPTDPSIIHLRQPIHSIATPSTPRNLNIIQNQPDISSYQTLVTDVETVVQVPTINPIIKIVESHPTTSTSVIPPPSNYINGNSHSPPHQVSSTDPADWTVGQVCDFIGTIDQANVEDIVAKFREHLIDGACLVDLKVELLINYLKIELGPAIKIVKRIEQLLSLSSPIQKLHFPPK